MSSDPSAVVLGPSSSVTIPAGSKSFAGVSATFLPTSKTEDLTLTATYRNSSLTLVVPVTAWPPLSIEIGADGLAQGDSTTAAVTIYPAAPTGGATVLISSSDPSAVTIPTGSVLIPAGTYQTTFTITGTYAGPPKRVTVRASYNNKSASTALYAPTAPIPPACRSHACAEGYYWNQDDCNCEASLPQ